MDGFYGLVEDRISWPEDTISVYRSNNVTIRNGVVEGNHSPTGVCVMFEGSDPDIWGGLL